MEKRMEMLMSISKLHKRVHKNFLLIQEIQGLTRVAIDKIGGSCNTPCESLIK
jgi:hypothetical protein